MDLFRPYSASGGHTSGDRAFTRTSMSGGSVSPAGPSAAPRRRWPYCAARTSFSRSDRGGRHGSNTLQRALA